MSTIEMKKKALEHLEFYIEALENAETEFQITANYCSACSILLLIYQKLELISDDECKKLDERIKKLHADAWERM